MERSIKDKILVVVDGLLSPIIVRPVKFKSLTPTEKPDVFDLTTSYRGKESTVHLITFTTEQCDRIFPADISR